MILSRAKLIAEGFTLSPSARFGILRKGNAVGSIQRKRPICSTYAGQCTPIADVIYTLAVGDIPEGHKVVLLNPEGPFTVDNVALLTPEEAKARISRIRSEGAKGKRSPKPAGLPKGIMERKPGYYVASFMRDGKRHNKAGKDISELTVWLLRERDGLSIGGIM
ncbi:TPA: hypothetical protein JLF61_001497 [Escherichia coli]|nr:hypothetical protein [Escherichia coli]